MNTFAIITLALFAALGWLAAYALLCQLDEAQRRIDTLQARLDASARRLNARQERRHANCRCARQVEWMVAE